MALKSFELLDIDEDNFLKTRKSVEHFYIGIPFVERRLDDVRQIFV